MCTVKNATGRYVITHSMMVSFCEAPEYYHLKYVEIYNAYVSCTISLMIGWTVSIKSDWLVGLKCITDLKSVRNIYDEKKCEESICRYKNTHYLYITNSALHVRFLNETLGYNSVNHISWLIVKLSYTGSNLNTTAFHFCSYNFKICSSPYKSYQNVPLKM